MKHFEHKIELSKPLREMLEVYHWLGENIRDGRWTTSSRRTPTRVIQTISFKDASDAMLFKLTFG